MAGRDVPAAVTVGACTLVCGEALSILATVPSGSIQACLTDPPYSSGGMFRADRMASAVEKYVDKMVRRRGLTVRPDFVGDNRDARGWAYWMVMWLQEVARVVERGGVVGVFCDWRQLPATTDVFQAAGLVWRGIVSWDKTPACRPQLGRYAAQCEYVVWGSVGPMRQAPEIGALPGSYSVAVNPREKAHLTGKPIALMRELVRIVPRGGVVLDPFSGSASTAVACRLEGRGCLAIEIDPVYHAIGVERVAAVEPLQFAEQADLLEGVG